MLVSDVSIYMSRSLSPVLILVLVDVGLGRALKDTVGGWWEVLILVLVDVGLGRG